MSGVLLSLLAGVLSATGVYLLLSRHMLRVVFGVTLLGTAANLVVFASGGLLPEAAPLIAKGASAPGAPVANPLPQALVLTAIVIGFALAAFALALTLAAYRRLGTLDPEAMRVAEPRDPEELPAESGEAGR